jgi:putative oxygen-independent coproporphyrinogen III oxidase
LQQREITSVFLGGGTPSLFSAKSLDTLLSSLSPYFKNKSIEITMEANPGSLKEEQEPLQGYRDAGINRLSFGVQSFQKKHLHHLGRIHTGEDAKTAVLNAQKAGFKEINIDLMYGLPHQSIEEALDDLSQACALNPTHLSWYQLTIEEKTLFHKYPPPLPTEDQIAAIMQAGTHFLDKTGWSHYEISAYTKNRLCTHNQHYWLFNDYLGIGAGASGKITSLKPFSIERRMKKKHPQSYLQEPTAYAEITALNQHTAVFECLLNVLRLTKATPWLHIRERLGPFQDFIDTHAFQAFLTMAIQQKLLESHSHDTHNPRGLLECTSQGHLFLNTLLALFYEHCPSP